jgi:hypothetical protein
LGGGGVVWCVMARRRITRQVLVGVGLWWRRAVILAVAIWMRVLRHVGGSRKNSSLEIGHFDDREAEWMVRGKRVPQQGGRSGPRQDPCRADTKSSSATGVLKQVPADD